MSSKIRAADFSAALFLACSVLLSGCNSIPLLQSSSDYADHTAAAGKWVRHRFDTPSFSLRGYAPAAAPSGGILAVYIEGDGAAWNGQRQPSDPTPTDTLTLQMAILDPTPNRLYLARPCQYLPPAQLQRCSPDYWASHRYAPEIVAALNTAIEREKRRTRTDNIALFGYSGGGALAVLLAARRSDVVRIVTVAGNLDHEAWIQTHRRQRLARLTGSLNAADDAAVVAHISQIHFVGRDDRIMPPAIAAAYLKRVSDPANISVVTVPDADHTCCWAEKWPGLLRTYVYPGL